MTGGRRKSTPDDGPCFQDAVGAEAEPSPKWMAGFGRLAHLHDETVRIQALIDADLRQTDATDQD